MSEEIHWFLAELPSTHKEIVIVPLGDLHYGSNAFSIRHLNRDLHIIAQSDNMYVVLMGDLLECVTKTSVGDVYRQVGTPQDQRDWMIEKLMAIKGKIIGMTTGNHEGRIYREVGFDISADIAKALDVPYREEGILLKVTFGGGNSRHPEKPYVYWIYGTHGYGGARTHGAKVVKLERVSTYIHADLYLMGHDHSVNVQKMVYLLPDPRSVDGVGRVTAHTKVLVKTNAFCKWGGYGERGGFAPPDLSTPHIVLKGEGKKRIEVVVR